MNKQQLCFLTGVFMVRMLRYLDAKWHFGSVLQYFSANSLQQVIRRAPLILLFSLFAMNICHASSDPDIIGTINFHDTNTSNVDMSFNYKDKAFYFSTVPISGKLLDMRKKSTPNNKYYNTSENKKYNVVLNIINREENITPENLKIVSIIPLSDEDTVAELSVNLLRIISEVLAFIAVTMVFVLWVIVLSSPFDFIFMVMALISNALFFLSYYWFIEWYEIPTIIQKSIANMLIYWIR